MSTFNITNFQTPKKTAKVLFSDTTCLTQEDNSDSVTETQPTNVATPPSEPINKPLMHEFNLTQKISSRSISDSHLNKNFDPSFETPSKERSASVGDIYNLVDKNEEISNNRFGSELNDGVCGESNELSDEEGECMFSPSKSTNTEHQEIIGTPAMYSISRRLSMSPITKSTKRMPKSMQVYSYLLPSYKHLKCSYFMLFIFFC